MKCMKIEDVDDCIWRNVSCWFVSLAVCSSTCRYSQMHSPVPTAAHLHTVGAESRNETHHQPSVRPAVAAATPCYLMSTHAYAMQVTSSAPYCLLVSIWSSWPDYKLLTTVKVTHLARFR